MLNLINHIVNNTLTESDKLYLISLVTKDDQKKSQYVIQQEFNFEQTEIKQLTLSESLDGHPNWDDMIPL